MEKYAEITIPIIPVIETDEPDKYGRNIRIGTKLKWNTAYTQVMSIEEVKALRDALDNFILNYNEQSL